jgi:hypothetical protein
MEQGHVLVSLNILAIHTLNVDRNVFSILTVPKARHVKTINASILVWACAEYMLNAMSSIIRRFVNAKRDTLETHQPRVMRFPKVTLRY